MAAATRPIRLVALGLTLTLAACGGDGGGPEGTPGPGGSADPASLCSEVLDERDEAVGLAGRDAALDVIFWAQRAEPPAAAEAEAAAEAMAPWRDQLVADRERLAGADVDAADADDWELVVGLLDDEIDRLEERIALLEADDDWAEAAVGIEFGGAGAGEDAVAALDALGLTGRDCEVVAANPGTPAEGRDFVVAAAGVCSDIVTRRRAGSFVEDRDRVLQVLVSILDEEDVVADDELTAALDRTLAEWEATRDDLAGVDADDAPDPEGWEQVLRLAEDRVALFEGRAAALETGDQDEIAAAFDPERIGEPGWEGFEPNHLGGRDCRSVEA